MSMERFLFITAPFGYTKLNQKTAKISLVLIWGLGLIMAIVPGQPFLYSHASHTPLVGPTTMSSLKDVIVNFASAAHWMLAGIQKSLL